MAEYFVGPVMDKIIDACSEYFKDQVGGKTDVEEELQRLRVIHPQIQAVISSYSQLEIEDPNLNKWYWQLRDAIDEADDVLDEFEYLKLERQVIGENKGKRKAEVPVWNIYENVKRGLRIGKPAPKSDPNLKRLEEAVQKLSKISAQVSTFLLLLDRANQKQEQQQVELHETRETGSTPANLLVGRSEEIDFVDKWLRNSYETQSSTDTTDVYRNISLLSVVGLGGIGKTTLLQHVYKDATLNKDGATEGFDVKMWACVSQIFDARTVIKNILESLLNERPNLETIEALQSRLKSQVTSKRFLLVLDDIWEENDAKWEKVLTPLKYGSSGSKILITTRMNSVASKIPMIENKKILPLMGLEEEECSLLFKRHAFGKNSNVHENFLSMAGDIVKKLSGSPLAAKLIGSSLRSKDLSYWRKVKTDIEKAGLKDLLPILKLSYTYLSTVLQICFAFCSIFPEDHTFDKNDLVRMWISLGFIQSSNNSLETIEEIGIKYFDILVEKSFFDKFQSKYKGVYYQMHDLLHELAQSVSKQECFRAADVKELSIPPKTIRHLYLSLDINSNLEVASKEMREFKNLRSLFLSCPARFDEKKFVEYSKILEASKSIRLLYINFHYHREISKMIGFFTHLRYIYLKSDVDQLPRSISQLYNLRYLIFASDKDRTIHEIGKLKSLQALSSFYVKNEIGYGIEELEHMNELRQIGIYELENINDVEEARRAKLYDKKNLTDLSLLWGNNNGSRLNKTVDPDIDEKILNVLKPYNNIKKLYINLYMGVRSPIWMSDVSMISNLEYITLYECSKWKTLPPFGQLPFLKSLKLYDMPEVEKLDHNKDCKFPSLDLLHIEKMYALQEWFDTTVATENGCFFPCLTELRLERCPKLQELPSLPNMLQKLEMKSIGWKGCNWLQGIKNCSSIDIKNSPSLIHLSGRQELKSNENCELKIDELVISDPSVLMLEPLRIISSLGILRFKENEELVSFPPETKQWFLQHSSSLFNLDFRNLQSLQSLPSYLECLSSLNSLALYDVPQLKLLPNPPASLVKLELHYLKSLQCLPSFLHTLLRILTICKLPRLLELPDLPFSLTELKLEKLESLQCLPSFLSVISSLETLKLKNIPHLELLPDLPSSLKFLEIEKLESLHWLPSSLLIVSSLMRLEFKNIPLLQSLPDLPSSLKYLFLEELESLQGLPSSLSTISSLTDLILKNISRLELLPDLPSSLKILEIEHFQSLQRLPSSLSTVSSLTRLKLSDIPLLQSLPDLPSSLIELYLEDLESLQLLPSSLSTITSLRNLDLKRIPRLKSLPDLPSSLSYLSLYFLENLDCLPSYLPTTLSELRIISVPLLLELPNLPSLCRSLILFCDPQLMERYPDFG